MRETDDDREAVYRLEAANRQLSELELLHTELHNLQERVRLYESAVVSANDVIVITEAEPLNTPGPRIIYVNDAFTRHTGYAAEEVIGKTPRILQGPKSDRATLGRIRTALENWQPILVELLNYRKDGSEFWSELSIVPVPDEKGWYTHWTSVQRDITERKQAEASRSALLKREQAARIEAEQANRIKDEFLATLSHELRTPLNAIVGFSQLLRMRRYDGPATDEIVRTIERNAKAQAQLVDDLLDVSRIITGKMRLEFRPVALQGVIRAALETITPSAEAKQIRLITRLDPEVGHVSGDATRLQQIIWNLLSNAIKFTPREGEVQVCLTCINSQVQLAVADTGVGIPAEFLPHVFERFHQGDGSTTRKYGGLGLGLAIVRHLVEAHGGTVGVQSGGEGQGSTFTISLPLPVAQANSHHISLVTVSTGMVAALPRLEGLKLLVVDDEPDARKLLGLLLEGCGAQVTVASSSAEALRVIEVANPDVLVSDIGMPEQDGYELIQQVRGRGFAVPAVALTAYARSEDRMRALATGFDTHVPKPVEIAELVAVIQRLIQRG
ncbi:MAG: response regulator [Gemmatimonadaceae bacterium]|nr:response regulator [Gloeobacterales cyanobacterium ES-bin-141]